MTRMDAKKRARTPFRLLSFSFVAVAIALVIVGVTARLLWGPDSATAQTAARLQPPSVSSSAQPAGTAVRTARATPQPANAARPDPGTVAIVNGERISRDQLAQECLRRFGEEVLESIVNRHLIWQACQQQGITITEQQVEEEIEQMAKKFGLSTEHWLQMLQQERGISPVEYRNEIVWPMLALRRLAAGRIEVTEEELREAFESEYGPKVKVRMIAVSSREKADQLHAQAVADPSKFGDLAKEYSEDANSAAARGLIPPIRKHTGHAEFEKVAFALKEGEISPVVQVANQYLILKCEKHLPETYVSSSQMAHLQSRLREQIRDQKLRTAAAELFQKLQGEAQIVNVFNDPQLSAQMPGVAATINGSQIPLKHLADECLARYGNEVLDGEINRLVLIQQLRREGKAVTKEAIDAEIARTAEAYGYLKPDGSPDVEAWLEAVTETEQVSVDLYVRDAIWPSVALKSLVGESIEVTDEDLQKGFVSNYGERVEVLAIVLGSQRQANTVWDMARNNPSDQFFGELAHQYSIEPVSRSNYGKVPPIRRFSGQPVVEEEAFRLQPGELSGILVVGNKYIILKCLGRTEPVVQDMAAVQDELAKSIYEKKLRAAMARKFDELKESSRIDNLLAGSSQPGQGAVRSALLPEETTTQRR